MIDHKEILKLLKEVDASERTPVATLAVLKARLWEMVERSQRAEENREKAV